MERVKIAEKATLTNSEIKAKLVFIESCVRAIYENGSIGFTQTLDELKAAGHSKISISFYASIINEYAGHQKEIEGRRIKEKLDKLTAEMIANDPELKDVKIQHEHMSGGGMHDITKLIESLFKNN